MRSRRHLVVGLTLVAALTVAGLTAACGGGGKDEQPADGAGGTMGAHMQQAMDSMGAMVAAAEAGDMEAAEAAFEDGHDPMHDLIDELEADDPDLAAELDEAVDDAEKDFDEGVDADHIVEIGNEILDLLNEAE